MNSNSDELVSVIGKDRKISKIGSNIDMSFLENERKTLGAKASDLNVNKSDS